MKKTFIIFLVSILFSGCAVTGNVALYKNTMADITRKNANGDIIEVWEGAIIEQVDGMVMPQELAYAEMHTFGKTFLESTGIKFYDADGKFHYIQGGIISVDNIVIDAKIVEIEREITDKELITKYQNLQRKYSSIYSSEERARLINEIIKIQNELKKREINYAQFTLQPIKRKIEKVLNPKEPKTKKISPKNAEKVNSLIEQAKAMDEIINTSTDAKEIRKAKNEKYEISQELYRRYGINLKKLKE